MHCAAINLSFTASLLEFQLQKEQKSKMKISLLEEIKLNFNYIFCYIIYLEGKKTHTYTNSHIRALLNAYLITFIFFPKTKNFIK